jgi:hypothetical protein
LRGGRGCVTVSAAPPNIWAKAPVVCDDHRTHRLKPGAIQNSDGDRTHRNTQCSMWITPNEAQRVGAARAREINSDYKSLYSRHSDCKSEETENINPVRRIMDKTINRITIIN